MLSQEEIRLVLSEAVRTGGDFAELFWEDKEEHDIDYSGGKVGRATTVRTVGVGIYLLRGEKSVYVCTNDLRLPSLLEQARRAAELLDSGTGSLQIPSFVSRQIASPNPVEISPADVDNARKIELLRNTSGSLSGYTGLRSMDIGYSDKDQRVMIANTEGLFTQDRRTACRLRLKATMEGKDGRLLSRWADYVCPSGFEAFRDTDATTAFAKNFLERIATSLKAEPIRSCTVPVVLDAGSCGTFWHECCGHPLESIAIASGSSEFCGQLGKKVASDKVTLLDDGTIPGMYGSEAVDDEGTPTRRNVLIENGVLKGYLCDRMGGRRLGMQSTGNGRKQDYTYAPTSRMTNTFLAPGTDNEEEMIRDIDRGLFVTGCGGGSGGREFSIEITEGWWIENGRLVHPVSGLTLNGRGMEVIKLVDRVGSRLAPDFGGFCGASSGLVPTTAFQPRIRVSAMAIGGTAE